MVIMTPYQHVMAFLFKQSKLKATDILAYTTHLNVAADKATEILMGAFATAECWRLLRQFTTLDAFRPEWKVYLRREVLRALGGAYCRLVEKQNDGMIMLAHALATTAVEDDFTGLDSILSYMRGGDRVCCQQSCNERASRFLFNTGSSSTSSSSSSDQRSAKVRNKRLRLAREMLKVSYRGCTLFVETMHAANQRRVGRKRGWERQVAMSAARQAKYRFAGQVGSPDSSGDGCKHVMAGIRG